MRQSLSTADGHDLGAALKETALVKNINNITLALGQKKGDQGNDHFPHAQDNEQYAAQDDDDAKAADERIGVNRENSAYPDDQYAKQRCKHPTFDFNARIKPFEKVLGQYSLFLRS